MLENLKYLRIVSNPSTDGASTLRPVIAIEVGSNNRIAHVLCI